MIRPQNRQRPAAAIEVERVGHEFVWSVNGDCHVAATQMAALSAAILNAKSRGHRAAFLNGEKIDL